MADYCERDLVKRRLEIAMSETSYDSKIDAAIAEASSIVDNKLVRYGGVPQPIPGIIEHACADLAAAIYKQVLDPTAEQPLMQRGLERIADYIAEQERSDLPFFVATAES